MRTNLFLHKLFLGSEKKHIKKKHVNKNFTGLSQDLGGNFRGRARTFRPPPLCVEAEKKKAHTTTTKRKSFGALFLPQRKLSRPVVDTKNTRKTKKTISTTKIFPLWTQFFLQRKVLHWSRVVYGFFFPMF